MPVTAKLSRKFYEQFGDELTNELVEWMNQVDSGYRTEFRELFELNFSRFEARLQQGLTELRTEFRESVAGLKGDLRTEIAASRAESLRWNFLFWIGTVGTVAALLKL
jgi:hypothetical protein